MACTSAARLANEAHADFTQGVVEGSILLNPKLSFNLQAGNYVDREVRDSNLILRNQLGLDATTVRINQRLYAPDGSYTVPDIHFPESTNSIDYSYQLKTTATPQISRIQQAAPNGIITIVPPAAIRPIYNIGP